MKTRFRLGMQYSFGLVFFLMGGIVGQSSFTPAIAQESCLPPDLSVIDLRIRPAQGNPVFTRTTQRLCLNQSASSVTLSAGGSAQLNELLFPAERIRYSSPSAALGINKGNLVLMRSGLEYALSGISPEANEHISQIATRLERALNEINNQEYTVDEIYGNFHASTPRYALSRVNGGPVLDQSFSRGQIVRLYPSVRFSVLRESTIGNGPEISPGDFVLVPRRDLSTLGETPTDRTSIQLELATCQVQTSRGIILNRIKNHYGHPYAPRLKVTLLYDVVSGSGSSLEIETWALLEDGTFSPTRELLPESEGMNTQDCAAWNSP